VNVQLQRASSLVPVVALAALALTADAAAGELAADACQTFVRGWGGFMVSVAFGLDAERQAVISPPRCAGAQERLWIRPLRLNSDDYLILQKCASEDCSQAEVVRAWNSYGYMGPYPVLADTLPVASAVHYMLWMQHVPLPGGRSFSQIDRDGPPLVFRPVGSLLAFDYARKALEAARERGPTPVTRAERKGSAYVATFQGGSSVWMRALRAEAESPPP